MTVQILTGAPALREMRPSRSLWTAVKRGLACRCPACGEGRLFSSYLKVAPSCERCGEALHHHRADDAPPYLTITIVGHVVVPLLLWLELSHEPELWIHFALWLPLTLGLCLALLPPMKGMVVGYQWAMRMHGFDENSEEARQEANP